MTVKCDRRLLSRYKDGEVSPQERREVEAHLPNCPDCAAVLAAYYSIGRSIAAMSRLRAPAHMRAELYTRIARQDRPQNRGSFFGSFFSGLALAGTAVALILILSVFFRGASNSSTVVLATAVYPPPNAAGIPAETTIEVQFNQEMDRKSVEESVEISPPVEANATWEGDKLVLKPVTGLTTNTSYTVVVSNKAKDAKGTPIKEPVVLSFSTVAEGAATSSPVSAVLAMASSTTPLPTATPEPAKPTPTAPPPATSTPSTAASWPQLVALDPKSPASVYVASSLGALYKSADGGANWRAIGSGLPAESYFLNALVVDPQVNQTLYTGTSQGVFKSTDGGESWSSANNGLPAAVASNGKPQVIALVMHPINRLVLYASLEGSSTPAALYRSTDGGASWSPLSSISAEGGAKVLGPYSLVFYPTAPSTLFAGTALGMFQSNDAGSNWLPANKNLTETITSLALQPKDYAALYATTSNGIYKTTRGSIDWQRLNVSATYDAARSLGIAPDGTLYALIGDPGPAGRRSSAFKSTDGGSTWTVVQGGLENTGPQSFAFDSANPRSIFAATQAGVFKSADGGNQWVRLGFSMLPTPTPQPELTVMGTITETLAVSLTVRIVDEDKQTWQVVLNHDPLQPTQIAFSDGKPALFGDLKPLTRVVAIGKADAQSRSSADRALNARSITIMAAKPLATPTVVPPFFITNTIRIGYVFDPMIGSGYNGDWPTHLRSRGYTVTPLDILNESSFAVEGYDLIVVSWLSGQLPAGNVAKLQNVKGPILNAYSPLVEKLDQGKAYDPGNPGRTTYGASIAVAPGGDALTRGYSGEVIVANDTLYRVPIIPAGTVLATVTDEQGGLQNAPVWTLSDKRVYFGFWYSKDGANHNEAYWTFFDRSVDYLLGKTATLEPEQPAKTTDK